jgi:hypothetical protein
MNRRELERLAYEDLPFRRPWRWYMEQWVCGTAACAFGGVCLSESGRAHGLSLVYQGGLAVGEPKYRNRYGFSAAAAYYGISAKDASWLFAPWKYDEAERDSDGFVQPVHVACRVITLLECLA